MKVLVGGEFSGNVRDAFLVRGHEAISCDLLPSERPGPHYQGDVRDLLQGDFDLFVVFPPCKYLCSSGLHWNGRIPGRVEKTKRALHFVKELLAAPIERIALENPKGRIGTAIRKADQWIQPWQFGHPEAKQTGLWLKNLQPLKPTKILPLPDTGRWANQTPSGQNKLTSARFRERAITYPGIAEAMAEQWG